MIVFSVRVSPATFGTYYTKNFCFLSEIQIQLAVLAGSPRCESSIWAFCALCIGCWLALLGGVVKQAPFLSSGIHFPLDLH